MTNIIVVGANGQDGRLLCGKLRLGGHKVWCVGNGFYDDPNGKRYLFDIKDIDLVLELLSKTSPHQIYYLAAFHHSSSENDWQQFNRIWEKSRQVHIDGYVNFLEAAVRKAPHCSIFYAASSLVFGAPMTFPQTELTPMNPTCVYGMTKSTGVQISRYFRNEKGLRVNVGILYTHESTLREERFVAKRIVSVLRKIAEGSDEKLQIADPEAKVDWGYAPDYVDAMTLICENDHSDDYIISTGEAHTVDEFIKIACESLGLVRDKVVEVKSIQALRSRKNLVGDSSKLKKITGWASTINFQEMVRRLALNEKEIYATK